MHNLFKDSHFDITLLTRLSILSHYLSLSLFHLRISHLKLKLGLQKPWPCCSDPSAGLCIKSCLKSQYVRVKLM